MATTSKDVFDIAMSMMDELSDTGATDTADTQEYKNRTLFILNALRGELYPYSDTYKLSTPGKRPIVSLIENFEDEIGLDDYICQSVLPYGLAAHLLMDENPTSANFFQQRYDELKAGLVRGIPVESEDVEDVYGSNGGVSPYNEFSMWR